VPLAGVHHGLDGEGHAGLEFIAGAGFAIVQNLRILVVHAADAMAAVLAHHGEVAILDVGLDGVSDVAEVGAGLHLFDAAPHGFPARFGQPLRGQGGFTHVIHAAGVAMETIADHGDVDVQDVAGLQDLVVRNSMAHDMVHRGADGLRETSIVHVGGNRLLDLGDVLEAQPIEFLGGHAGFDVIPDHVENLGCQAAGDAHFFLLGRGLNRDVSTHEGVHRVYLRKALF
jgi:hypothetical protein